GFTASIARRTASAGTSATQNGAAHRHKQTRGATRRCPRRATRRRRRPPVPAREAAPDPGFGTRWPEAAPAAAIVAGPRAEPAPVVASATPVPQPMGARPGPTERGRNEPAPPKPPRPAQP